MFRDRTRREIVDPAAAHSIDKAADQALAELLQSRPLRAHRLTRNCEIGPFILDYVFGEQSLIVELQPGSAAPERYREGHDQARAAFLTQMGYRIVRISRREVVLRPERTLARIQAALHQGADT